MQNLNERGAAYIPIAEARGITPHYDNRPCRRFRTGRRLLLFSLEYFLQYYFNRVTPSMSSGIVIPLDMMLSCLL